MYSEELFRRIAICGGFFSLKLFSERNARTLRKYILRHDLADVISTSRRQETGYLFKVRDDILKKYYDPDARKRTRIFSVTGSGEFHRKTGEYMVTNNKSPRISHHYDKKWYRDIHDEMIVDNRYSRYTGYVISDYKIFVCFTRILATIEYGTVIIPKKQEKDFRLEHGLLDKKQISTGITFGYSFSRQKVIILVSDFMKSERSLMQILLYYNSPEFEILIYTLRPAEMLEARLRKKLSAVTGSVTVIKVVDNPYLNQFFGEY